jgi:hypothetical protein
MEANANRLLKQSAGPHFVYQADALLHGQFENRMPAPNDNDWIRYEGKTYVCFPPAPAVLMMPLVAIFGIHFNDVLFTLPFAALNVLLMFLILQMLVREKLSGMSLKDNLWLTALFGFGTVHYSCSVSLVHRPGGRGHLHPAVHSLRHPRPPPLAGRPFPGAGLRLPG